MSQATKTKLNISLRVVLYRECDEWIAHCLEFDLLGSGATHEDALQDFLKATVLQVEASLRYDNPANLFSPAPGEFFHKFAAGKDVVMNLKLSIEQFTERHLDIVEGIVVREYVDPPQYDRQHALATVELKRFAERKPGVPSRQQMYEILKACSLQLQGGEVKKKRNCCPIKNSPPLSACRINDRFIIDAIIGTLLKWIDKCRYDVVWRSRVAHLVWDRRVRGSNPLAPTQEGEMKTYFTAD